jgi:hypothetical protein
MNPAIPTPVPVPLPAPAWLLLVLSVFTLILHLLAMNFLLGGSVILTVSSFVGRRNLQHREFVRRVSQALPPVVAFTITLGVSPLLFLQLVYGQLFYTSSVLMAWAWLAVVLLVLLGYYGVYWFNLDQADLGPRAPWVILVTAVLFLVVAFIFTQNMSFMLRPQDFYTRYLTHVVGRGLGMVSLASLARWLHFVVAALAIGGLGVALLSRLWRNEVPELATWARAYGVKWFIAGTLIQFLSGLWFLSTLSADVRQGFLGGDRISTGVIALAIVLALLAISSAPRSIFASSVAIVGTISLMAVARHLVRVASLRPFFDPRALPVQDQWPVFFIFVVFLVGGLVTVSWMLYVFFRPAPRTAP